MIRLLKAAGAGQWVEYGIALSCHYIQYWGLLVNWEKVHTVNQFYDCPILGVADFRGVPHIYQAIMDTPELADQHIYHLMAIDEELLRLVVEGWELWIQKIEGSTNSSEQVSNETRRLELKEMVDDRLIADPEKSFVMKADFRKQSESQSSWKVCWFEHNQ